MAGGLAIGAFAINTSSDNSGSSASTPSGVEHLVANNSIHVAIHNPENALRAEAELKRGLEARAQAEQPRAMNRVYCESGGPPGDGINRFKCGVWSSEFPTFWTVYDIEVNVKGTVSVLSIVSEPIKSEAPAYSYNEAREVEERNSELRRQIEAATESTYSESGEEFRNEGR